MTKPSHEDLRVFGTYFEHNMLNIYRSGLCFDVEENEKHIIFAIYFSSYVLRISRKLKENCNAVRASRNLNVQRSAVAFEHIEITEQPALFFRTYSKITEVSCC
jgi:hypothetical protein